MEITRDWYLEINSVPLACPAWEIPDLSPLLDSGTLRGADVIIPGVEGVVANRRRRTVHVVTLPLDVMGDLDVDGNPTPDPLTGTVSHLDYLGSQLGFASGVDDGTVEAVFHRGDDLPALSTDVHFLGFKGSQKQGEFLVRTTFDISIPSGTWVEVGS